MRLQKGLLILGQRGARRFAVEEEGAGLERQLLVEQAMTLIERLDVTQTSGVERPERDAEAGDGLFGGPGFVHQCLEALALAVLIQDQPGDLLLVIEGVFPALEHRPAHGRDALGVLLGLLLGGEEHVAVEIDAVMRRMEDANLVSELTQTVGFVAGIAVHGIAFAACE